MPSNFGIVALTGLLGRRNAPEPSHPQIDRWYHGLNKPPYTPPDPVFGAVWPVIEVALACGGFRLLRAPASSSRNAAVALWFLNAGMIGGWTELFFRRNRLGPSAAVAAGMFAAGIGYVAVARRVDTVSAAAGLPYVGWMGFATVLAKEVWRRNDARA